MPESEQVDILIIGAGPAGISTALHLAKTAPDLASHLVILEKARHPRAKLCAGGLTGDAVILLKRLGLDVDEVPHATARAAKFNFHRHGLHLFSLKKYFLRMIRRDEFDAWLVKKARERGIRIGEGVTVQEVHREKDGVVVQTDAGTWTTRILVGADGSNGIVRRQVLPKAPLYTARALEVVTPVHINSKHRENRVYFELSPVPRGIAGYIWDFPTRVNGTPMRTWGIYDANLYPSGKRPPLKDLLAKEMSRFGFTLDNYELKGHPIRWFDPTNDFSLPRVLLVGDAAGADPMLGEGISMALGYGLLAARTIRNSLKKGDLSFRDYRWRILASPMGQALILRWLITYLLYTLRWSWFQALIWWVLQPVTTLIAHCLVLGWGRRMRIR